MALCAFSSWDFALRTALVEDVCAVCLGVNGLSVSLPLSPSLPPPLPLSPSLSLSLQVVEVPLRIVALRTALAEMPDPYARAQFYDVKFYETFSVLRNLKFYDQFYDDI